MPTPRSGTLMPRKMPLIRGPLRLCGTCNGRGSVPAKHHDGLWFSTPSGGHFEVVCPTCNWSGFENATPEQARESERRAVAS
jgi:hypothetical protein